MEEKSKEENEKGTSLKYNRAPPYGVPLRALPYGVPLRRMEFLFLQYHSLFIIEYETQLNNKSTMSR